MMLSFYVYRDFNMNRFKAIILLSFLYVGSTTGFSSDHSTPFVHPEQSGHGSSVENLSASESHVQIQGQMAPPIDALGNEQQLINELQNKVRQKDETIQELQQEVNELERVRQFAGDREEKLLFELNELRDVNDTLNNQLGQKDKTIQQLQQWGNKKEIALQTYKVECQNQLEPIMDRLQKLYNENESLVSTVDGAMDIVDEAGDLYKSLETREESLGTQLIVEVWGQLTALEERMKMVRIAGGIQEAPAIYMNRYSQENKQLQQRVNELQSQSSWQQDETIQQLQQQVNELQEALQVAGTKNVTLSEQLKQAENGLMWKDERIQQLEGLPQMSQKEGPSPELVLEFGKKNKEIKQLTRQNEQLQQQLTDKDKEIKQLMQEKDELNKKYSSENEKFEKKVRQIVQSCENMPRQLADKKKEIKQLIRENEQLDKRFVNKDKQFEENAKQMSELQQELDALKQKQSRVISARLDQQGSVQNTANLARQLELAQQDSANLRQQFAESERDKANLKKQLEESERNSISLSRQIESYNKKSKANPHQQLEAAQQNLAVTDATVEIANLRQQLLTSQQDNANLHQQLEDKDSHLRAIQCTVRTIQQQNSADEDSQDSADDAKAYSAKKGGTKAPQASKSTTAGGKKKSRK